jgi:hypothetical protein
MTNNFISYDTCVYLLNVICPEASRFIIYHQKVGDTAYKKIVKKRFVIIYNEM